MTLFDLFIVGTEINGVYSYVAEDDVGKTRYADDFTQAALFATLSEAFDAAKEAQRVRGLAHVVMSAGPTWGAIYKTPARSNVPGPVAQGDPDHDHRRTPPDR